MSLIDNLPFEDKSSIEYYIRNYARAKEYYSGELDLNTSLQYWNRDKENLFSLLDDHFILEKEITFEKSLNQKEQEMTDSGLTYGYFINRIRDNLLNQAKAEANSDRWFAYPRWYIDLIACFAPKALARNTYDGKARIVFTVKDYHGQEQKIVVQPGEKITRILHKLAKAYHLEEEYEEFRIKHSMVLNTQTFHGTLCLSIHPIDFMTMSDNSYNWTSCMSWQDNGCYREGTIECMNSPYAVIGYLKGSEPMREGGHVFPNKKWRELFIVHPDAILGVKGYPYTSDDLEKTCVEWLRDLAIKNWGWKFPDAEVVPANPNSLNTWYYVGKTYVRCLDFDFMYNDMFTDRTIHYACFQEGATEGCVYIDLSSCVRCIICGDYLDSDDCDGGMGVVCCEYCDGVVHCACCGGRIHSGSVNYTLDDEPYCEYCWDNYAVYSRMADDYYHEDDLTSVYLIPRDFEPSSYSEFYNYPATEVPTHYLSERISRFVRGIEIDEFHSKRFEAWPWHNVYFIYEDEVDEDTMSKYWDC